MKAEEFENAVEIKTDGDLVDFLARRFGNEVNSFWLYHKQHPSMSIMVNGKYATIMYFPKARHPGFRPVGNVKELKAGETSTFFLDDLRQEQRVLNDAVIPVADAVKAAKEFFHDDQLPASIRWFEL